MKNLARKTKSVEISTEYADVAELADALDLGWWIAVAIPPKLEIPTI